MYKGKHWTKYIKNDYKSLWKTRLQQLIILPLILYSKLNDIFIFVHSYKSPSAAININNHFNLIRF